MKKKYLFEKDEKSLVKFFLTIWVIGFLLIVIGFICSVILGWIAGIIMGGFVIIMFILTLQIMVEIIDIIITLKLFKISKRK